MAHITFYVQLFTIYSPPFISCRQSMTILYQEGGGGGIVKNLNLCGDFPDKDGCQTCAVYFTNVGHKQMLKPRRSSQRPNTLISFFFIIVQNTGAEGEFHQVRALGQP